MYAWISRVFDPDDRIGAAWCSLMHDAPAWPIHARYECRVCGRQYRVPWAEPEWHAPPEARRAPLPSLRSALLPVLLLVAVLARPGLASESMIVDSSPAAVTLERFIANQHNAKSWPVETIEIDASLPTLKRTGRLLAIRKLLPAGHHDYRVLETAGDPTVNKQVIVRYVSAEERVTELPADSVAVTPANYKIRYTGSVQLPSGIAYAFRIVPRKKREGLINGVLWLDGATAIAVRESGHVAKRPSVFLKRISLTRETDLQGGEIEARITHVAVVARLVGRAQLVIVERPLSDTEAAAAVPVAGQ
jgi:hypothetical protein